MQELHPDIVAVLNGDQDWCVVEGDCRELLPAIPTEAVDAVVTDPPYGIKLPCNFGNRGRGHLAKANNYPDVYDDDKPFDPTHILAMGVPTILWGGNYFADKLPPTSGWLVWDKLRPAGMDQADAELAWTNCVKSARTFHHQWNGFIRESERRQNYHPTQKPVALFEWILSLKWLKDVRVVLDPYAGSGPCGVACRRMGIRYIGIEIEPDYCHIARDRISAESPALTATNEN